MSFATIDFQRSLLPVVLLLWLLTGCARAPATLDTGPPLAAGAAAVKITPRLETFEDLSGNNRWDPGEPFQDLDGDGQWDGVWLAGFSPGRAALTIHDDLWARAVVLTAGGRTLVIVSLDLLGYLGPHVEEIQKALSEDPGIDPGSVFVCASHTHHGPDTVGLWGAIWGMSGVDPAYIEQVAEAVVTAVRRAHADLREVRLRRGVSEAQEVLRDSREPEVMDPRVVALGLEAGEENLATIVIYACHPEALHSKSTALSSDYVHYLREALEREGAGMAMFLPGALGGMQTPKLERRDFTGAEEMGELLAARALEALDHGEVLEGARIESRTQDLMIPLTNPRFRLAYEMGLFEDAIARMHPLESGKLIEHVGVQVGAIRIGPISISTVPGEMFPELGRQVQERMVGQLRVIFGLANHEIGYIIPEEGWTENGYEESMSLGRETGPMILEGLNSLWKELGGGMR